MNVAIETFSGHAGNGAEAVATPDNKHVEAMLADLIKGPFAGQKFKFHQTDPASGKREVREIGG